MHSLNIGLQLKIYELENRMGVPQRQQFPFFEEMHEPFVKMILPQIKPEICLEDEWVYREGDVGHCMYMINQGEFRVHLKYEASHTDGGLLRQGECFGVNSILPSLKEGVRVPLELVRSELRARHPHRKKDALLAVQAAEEAVMLHAQARLHAQQVAAAHAELPGVNELPPLV